MESQFDNFISERQAEDRFQARHKRGNPVRGRRLLADIRQRFATQAKKHQVNN